MMRKLKLTLCLMLSVWTYGIAQDLNTYLYSTVTHKLERTVTKGIPANMKPYRPAEFISMATKGKESYAVIVKADKAENNKWAELLQTALSKAWGVKVPLVDWEEAKGGSKNIILFGKPNYNMALRELDANNLLGKNDRGYELRTIPNTLAWKKDVLYIDGKDDTNFKKAIDILVKKIVNPDKIAHFIECEGWAKEDVKKDSEDFMKEMVAHYAKDDSRRNNLAIQNILAKPVDKYKMTGDEGYVKSFSELMNFILLRYDKFIGTAKAPPTFEFHVFPTYLYNIENSTLFSGLDRLKSVEFMRRIAEDAMNYWEMKDPMEFYGTETLGYITNHSCFASRTVSSIARYLITRYDFAPAKYWKEVADNAFDGVALNPYSPEDAAGYQYLVYRIFVDYALTSGRYKMDFFRSPMFQGYLRFAKAQYNHLGYLAGYGDAFAIGHYSSEPFLKQAIELFDDDEAKYLLDLIDRNRTGKGLETKITKTPPGSETYGLNYFLLNEFKKEQYKIKNYFTTPLLDKAIFRSGWDSHADFLTVTGINGDGRNHGHFDANGLSQYIVGDRLWLWEGDYIKKFPDDHNSMIVNRNGKNFDFSRNFQARNKAAASQVKVALESGDKSQSLLSLLLEQYNGVNWIRNINYLAGKGLWIIDEVDVLVPGDYAIEIYWRSVGNVSVKDQGVQLTQRPSSDGIANNFFIAEGSGSVSFTRTLFEASHGRKSGNIAGYKKNYDLNTRKIVQRKQGTYQKGDKLYYANFMHAVGGKNPISPIVHKLQDNVYAARSGEDYHVAIIGAYKSGVVEVDANKCFLGPTGILAAGAKNIKIGKYTWTSQTPKDVVVDYKDLDAAYLTALKGLYEQGELLKSSNPQNIETSDIKLQKAKMLKSNVSSIAQQNNHVAIGTADGSFLVMDERGRTFVEHKFARKITAICPVKTSQGIKWAVAVFPENTTDGKATLHLIDENGQISWTNTINSWHNRNGTVVALFTAKLDNSGEPSIIAGSEAWHYYAFVQNTGKQIWRAPITHGATVGAAGDMNGDGFDDIASGAEYYYHELINHKGTRSTRTTTSPSNYSVVVKDLNGDGKKEAVFGRGDGWLYVNVPSGNSFRTWRTNVGGKPIAIVDIENGATKLAAATEMGDVVYLDGAGKVVTYTRLPGQLTDLNVLEGTLIATCIDGYVYTLDLEGKILSKSSYEYDPNSIYPAKISTGADLIAFYAGKDIYFMTKKK